LSHKNRGVTAETAFKFQIGFAPTSFAIDKAADCLPNTLLYNLTDMGYTISEILDAGLAINGSTYSRYSTRFMDSGSVWKTTVPKEKNGCDEQRSKIKQYNIYDRFRY
jgi:hypothetical protein